MNNYTSGVLGIVISLKLFPIACGFVYIGSGMFLVHMEAEVLLTIACLIGISDSSVSRNSKSLYITISTDIKVHVCSLFVSILL